MWEPKLTKDEKTIVYKTMQAPHDIDIGIELRQLNNEVIHSLDNHFLEGQVNVDAKSITGRSATLGLLDADKTMKLLTGHIWTNRMVHIEYRVRVPELNRWVAFPCFVGPIVEAHRQGDVAQITCNSKAQLAMHGIHSPYTVKKGTKRTDAIRRIMRELTGEDAQHMDIPDLPTKMVHDCHLVRQTHPWDIARKLAQSMNRHLHYDPAGVLRMPRFDDDASPVWTFENGNFLMGVPVVTTNMKDLINAVAVFGKDADNALATAILKETNKYAPIKIGRADAGAFFWREVTNLHVTEAEAKKLANSMLRRATTEHQDVEFVVMPFPGLDEDDPIKLKSGPISMTTRATKFTLPLSVESNDLMSIGVNRRVSLNRLAGG